MLPETMTVIEAKGHGGPEVLVPGTRPVPVPGAGEVLIAVKAAGVNRPDVLQRQGLYPPPKGASDLLGHGSRRARRGARSWRDAIQGRRCRLRADQWRRLCRVLRGAGKRRPCRCRDGLSLVEAAASARNRVHRVAQRVRARRPQARRMAARAWRRERHRHHRDTNGQALRRQRAGDRRQRREGAGLRGARCRPRHQLSQRGFRRGGEGGDRRPRRRRHSRHGRRRLYRAGPARCGA